jgi:dienelactone hydrolase
MIWSIYPGVIALLFMLCAVPVAAADIDERILAVPVRVQGPDGQAIAQDIVVTVFEARGRSTYPLMVLNHGRPAGDNRAGLSRARYSQAARFFAEFGFSVWVPTRIGYGASGTTIDAEYAGPCNNRNFARSFGVAADQVEQVINAARREPRIDAQRIVLVGQSYGGATSIAVATRRLPGVVAAINFAGGGGNPETRPGEPCSASISTATFGGYGHNTRVPTLWIYTENDRYFGPRHSQAWFAAFQANGGKGEFLLLPPFGDDGHRLFVRGFDIWAPLLQRFLREQGFSR